MTDKKKAQIHEFPLGIYPRKIWIAYKYKKQDIKDMFCSRDFSELDLEEEIGNEASASVYPSVMFRDNGCYGVLILIKTRLSVGQIAHEAGHVATEVFSDIGSYLDPNNQEPFMYLLGYVADCIDKVIKNKFEYE